MMVEINVLMSAVKPSVRVCVSSLDILWFIPTHLPHRASQLRPSPVPVLGGQIHLLDIIIYLVLIPS